MRITSDRALIPVLSVGFLVVSCIFADIIFVQDTYSSTPFRTRCIWMACIAMVWFLPMLEVIIVFGRKLEMNEDGCMISLGCFKKFYTWDQFVTKRVEAYKPSKLFPADYEKCVFFSTRFYALGNGAFTGNCMCLHPWSCFIIHSDQDPNKGHRGRYFFKIYEVDMQQFERKMQGWGVDVEGLIELN